MQQLTKEHIQQEAERRYRAISNKHSSLIPNVCRELFADGATWAIQQLSSPDKTAEERAKELYPDGLLMQEVDINTHHLQLGKQKAYLTGRKEARQQPVDTKNFIDWCIKWVVKYNDDMYFSNEKGSPLDENKFYSFKELYQQFLQTLK